MYLAGNETLDEDTMCAVSALEANSNLSIGPYITFLSPFYWSITNILKRTQIINVYFNEFS